MEAGNAEDQEEQKQVDKGKRTRQVKGPEMHEGWTMRKRRMLIL